MGEALRKLSRPPLTCWVLTDGKAGDETQCLGVAEALGMAPTVRRVSPRPPWSWLMPLGPIDPRQGPDRPGSPVAPPFPALAIASGRRAVPYLRTLKRASGGRTFTVFLKDPRTGPGAADLIWVPAHDRLRGSNVMATLTAPHRLSAGKLARARAEPDPRVASLPEPRVGVLVGGDSRHHRFTPVDEARLLARLRRLADEDGVSLAITASRRTPAGLRERLRALAAGPRHFLWDGTGENPYLSLLAATDAVVVTADSTNMVGEAAATGRPVLVFEPSGGHPKIATLLHALREAGIVRSFEGRLEGDAYPPLDSTPAIARAVQAALARHLDAMASGPPER